MSAATPPLSGDGVFVDGIVACHECDAVHQLEPLKRDQRAHCVRCGAVLYRDARAEVDDALAFSLSALVLFLIANVFPFIGLKLQGRIEENVVISGVTALYNTGQPELAVLVGLTSVAFPAITILGMLWLLVPLKFGVRPAGATRVFRVVQAIGPWTLLGVFMLGVIIAFVKLGDIATVVPGISMVAFVGLMLAAAAAASHFDSSMLWPPAGPRLAAGEAAITAHELGLSACHTCGLLVTTHESDADGHHGNCPRCTSALHGPRKPDALTRTWALVAASVVLCIPANVYPVMTVIRFGQGEPSTILGGVVHLMAEGMIGLAFIVFFASIVVPFMKLGLLIYLLVSVQRRSAWRPRDRTRMYRLTEVVGAWSMVDIFLVGILSALVQLGALATIEAGLGASFFGAVVVVTMLAAHSFDPRLIWDHAVRPA